MKKPLLLPLLCCAGLTIPAALAAEEFDFERIVHWTGEGPNRAALLVRFNDDAASDAGTIVWGYRWPEGESRTSDRMISDIARSSDDLVILIQYTGGMGYTLDGIGYSPDVNLMMGGLWFDYDAAAADGNVSFGYVYPNSGMGQKSAPGEGEARDLCQQAIDAALDTHVIDHPLNQRAYGYPAYDYDHWKLDTSRLAASVATRSRWRSGWYWGYWSFWVGANDFTTGLKQEIENLTYSGMGMSSTPINDGQISAWRYQPLSGKPIDPSGPEADGTTGASTRWGALAYEHTYPAIVSSSCASASVDDEVPVAHIYSLGGVKVATVSASVAVTSLGLQPGVYMVRNGAQTSKLMIK